MKHFLSILIIWLYAMICFAYNNRSISKVEQLILKAEKTVGNNNVDQALDILFSAINILEKDSIPYEGTDIEALIAHDLAACHFYNGHPELAYPYIERSLEIREKIMGVNHSWYQKSLEIAILIYYDLQNYNKTIQYGILFFQLYGDKPITNEIVHLMTTLALAHIAIDDNINAFNWMRTAFYHKRFTLNYLEKECLSELHNLSYIYAAIGHYSDAITIGELVLQHKSTNKDLSYARTSHIVSSAYARLDKIPEAISWAEESLKVKKSYNDTTKSTAITLDNLAVYYMVMGDFVKGIQYSLSAHEIYAKSNIIDWKNLQHIAIGYEKLQRPDSAKFYYNCMLQEIRHLLTNRTDLITNLRNPSLLDISTKLKAMIGSEVPYDIGYDMILLSKTFSQTLSQQERIVNSSSIVDITWKDIAERLYQREIAIEFLQENSMDSTISVYYLRHDWNIPKYTEIHLEDDFTGTSIWQAIIETANIQPNENIYFAPDGVLCNIPIEYLSLPNGKPMNEVYNMYRLSSTRELCFRDTTQTYQTATLYGGLFYDTDSTTIVTESEKYKSTNRDINMMDNSIISQWRANDRANYQYLPYSKIEVNDICEILKGKTIDTKVYTETSGNEESFKALSGNAPDILHIATHGYYITPLDVEVASKIALQRMGINIDERHNIIDYSMERTGLLLAGATLKLQHDTQIKGVEDGILSAKEISTLDLSHVDLAVLSACKTGLGDITSDGVAGLQRGFKCAGVNSILMTLWEVDDAATHLFMSQFYQNLMNGKSKHESLQNAQKFLKEYKQDGEYIYDDYHYWAAFVLLDGI